MSITNSERELLTGTDDELDELMNQIIDCQVEINHLERDSQNDVWSLVQSELDDLDSSFSKWITEVEVMFITFVFEANDIINQIYRDRLSLAESIETILNDACADQSIQTDNIQLEYDVIQDLSSSDGVMVNVCQDIDALTSSHDAIFDEVVAIHKQCENIELSIQSQGSVHKQIGDFLYEKVVRKIRKKELLRMMNAEQSAISKDKGKKQTTEVNPVCKKKKNPFRNFVNRVRSVASNGLHKQDRSLAYVVRRDG